MKNITNINIKDLEEGYNISLQGYTDPQPVKNGYTQKKLTSGKTRILSINVTQNTVLNIEKCSESEYLKLYKTWKNGNTVIIKTEYNKSFMGLIVGQSLVLSINEDLEGNNFYFGTIQIDE
jgi:hypothetical protein